MSRINGEKSRANIAKRRRTAQRESDRARRAKLAQASGAKKAAPAAKTPRARKPAATPESQ
jgi:hypothetical protein